MKLHDTGKEIFGIRLAELDTLGENEALLVYERREGGRRWLEALLITGLDNQDGGGKEKRTPTP